MQKVGFRFALSPMNELKDPRKFAQRLHLRQVQVSVAEPSCIMRDFALKIILTS